MGDPCTTRSAEGWAGGVMPGHHGAHEAHMASAEAMPASSWWGRSERAAPLERLAAIIDSTPRAIAVVVAMLGVGGIVAWVLDGRARAGLPGVALATKPNESVGLVLVGVALWLRASSGRLLLVAGAVLAVVVALLGACTVAQDIFHVKLGIDTAILRGTRPGVANRMTPATSLAFVFQGLALVYARPDWDRRTRIVEWATMTGAGLAYLGLLGHVYGVRAVVWVERVTAMALPISVGLLLATVGVLCVPRQGAMRNVFLGRGLGGKLARRLIPASIVIPTSLGLVRLLGEHIAWYGGAFGAAALVVTTVALFGTLTSWTARTLERLDADRTQAMQAEKAHSRARELERRRIRAVLDVLPVGVIITQRDGRVTDVNEVSRRNWGDDLEWSPSMNPRTAGRIRWSSTGNPAIAGTWGLSRAVRTGESTWAEELDVEHPGGQSETILNYSTPVRDEDGTIVAGVSVNVDITARRRAERDLVALKEELEERVRLRTAELDAANAELASFSYSVSHDLRAPLRWITGFSEALAEDYASSLDETGRAYIRHIRESARHMGELIDALLRLARVTREPLQLEPIELADLAEEVARAVDAEYHARHIEWVIEKGAWVRGDRQLLRVLLDNLLRNAVKFTRDRADARIEVGTILQDGEQIWFVKDNGIGFDMRRGDRLFRTFEQLHGPEYEGTGIGLALAKQIVRRHGGRIWAESEPGVATTFSFTLRPQPADAASEGVP